MAGGGLVAGGYLTLHLPASSQLPELGSSIYMRKPRIKELKSSLN